MPVTSTLDIQGFSVPSFLYGTAWKEDDTERCVYDALKAGFRGIDTANQRKHYFEAGVGSALQKAYSEGLVSREDLFLQTKYTFIDGQDSRLPYDPNADIETQVFQSVESSLEHLGTDYLDSYVLHGPSLRHGLSDADWEAWAAMEQIKEQGRAGLLGVSNVSLQQLALLYENAKIKPAFVQNRCFAQLGWDYNIRRFCRKNDVYYQGFSLLTANPMVFSNPAFQQTFQQRGMTPAQVVFRFSLQVGMLPLTGTTNPQHMQEDLQSYQLELSDEECELIERCLVA